MLVTLADDEVHLDEAQNCVVWLQIPMRVFMLCKGRRTGGDLQRRVGMVGDAPEGIVPLLSGCRCILVGLKRVHWL